jgi:hypothetical protein
VILAFITLKALLGTVPTDDSPCKLITPVAELDAIRFGEQRKPMEDLKKILVNHWNMKRITRRDHVGRGHGTKWEIPVKKLSVNVEGQQSGTLL